MQSVGNVQEALVVPQALSKRNVVLANTAGTEVGGPNTYVFDNNDC